MPYEIQMEQALTRVTFRGKVTSEELQQYAKEIAHLEAGRGGSRKALTDLTAVEELNMNAGKMRDFAAARGRSVRRFHLKSAIVAPRDLEFGMSRMFEMIRKNPKIETKVFRDVASAMQWLEGSVAKNA